MFPTRILSRWQELLILDVLGIFGVLIGAFMIDTHAHIISNDVDGSTFDHNVECPKHFIYSLDVMPYFSY